MQRATLHHRNLSDNHRMNISAFFRLKEIQNQEALSNFLTFADKILELTLKTLSTEKKAKGIYLRGKRMQQNLSQTIVLVDDESQLLDLHKLRLKSLGCSFLSFSKPQDFLEHLKANPDFSPDLVITDFMMPSMNGVQMIQEALKLRKSFPSILLSGYIDKDKAIAATNSGVWNILEKPADKEHLLSLATKLLLESRIRKLGSEIRVVMSQLTEMFSAFRLLCVDEIELEAMHRPVVMESPNDPHSNALSLEQALNSIEQRLQNLALEEAKISHALDALIVKPAA